MKNQTTPCTLRELANLIEGSGYRLVLNGRDGNNYLLQHEERDHSTGNYMWVNCGGYRYAEQFFACGTAAEYIATIARDCEDEAKAARLADIANQMDALCDARMRREKIGKYAEQK